MCYNIEKKILKCTSSRTWGRRSQGEQLEEKGCQCEARPDQCVFTKLFRAVKFASLLVRKRTNSGNCKRLSLLPGLVVAMIFCASA